MASSYVVLDNDKAHFVTLTIVEWIHLFDQDEFREIALDSLRYSQKKRGLIIYAYVIMPSHIHLIIRAAAGIKLWAIIRDYKKYTAKMILETLLQKVESNAPILNRFKATAEPLKNWKNYKVWQEGYHGIAIFSEVMFCQKRDYIHNNPVKAGLSSTPKEYAYSSCRNYDGLKGVLEIEHYF